MSEPKQLTIEEIVFSDWYKASEFVPPDLLRCTLVKQEKAKISFSEFGAAYYCSKRKGWFWFGESQENPDKELSDDDTLHWSPAL